MDATKRLVTKTYRHFMHDSMHRNSTLLILSQAIMAGCGFLFWVINARLFSAENVGLATSFISFAVLAATFTNLGLPNTVIRFLPTSKRRGGLFTASLLLVLFSSILGGIIALFLARQIAPKLAYIHMSTSLSILFISLVVATAVSVLLDGTLIAFRKGEYVLSKVLIINIPRILLPFFAVAAGVRGITSIYTFTLILGIVFNLIVIYWGLLWHEKLRPTIAEVGKHMPYAASNYFGGMFGVLPSTLTPIIVLGALGAASAAYFYMPMMIAIFLSLICNSVSQALIAECSHTDDIQRHKIFFRRALRHQYQLLVPAILIVFVIGWPILRIYGPAYAANGYLPLLLLSVSGLFVGINWLGDTWLNINKRSRAYFLMNAFNALVVVGFVYILAPRGLVAAAFGWFCGQLVSAAVYLAIFARGKLLTFLT